MSIRERSTVKDDGTAKYGPQPPSDGWHIFKFDCGNIKIAESDYGPSILIRFIVDDETDADNGRSFSNFINMEGDDQKRVKDAEAKLCNLLVQTGIADLVDQRNNFPKSLFAPNVAGVIVEMMSALLVDKNIALDVITTAKGKTYYNESKPLGELAANNAAGTKADTVSSTPKTPITPEPQFAGTGGGRTFS